MPLRQASQKRDPSMRRSPRLLAKLPFDSDDDGWAAWVGGTPEPDGYINLAAGELIYADLDFIPDYIDISIQWKVSTPRPPINPTFDITLGSLNETIDTFDAGDNPTTSTGSVATSGTGKRLTITNEVGFGAASIKVTIAEGESP